MQKGSLSIVFVETECVICLAEKSTQIFNPCRHMCCCSGCAEQVLQSGCPMCRATIDNTEKHNEEVQPVIKKITKEDWERFMTEERDAYVGRMVKRNAGLVGRGKQARAVAEHMGSELGLRERETKGGERCMSKNKTTEERDGILYVTYKVGRRLVKEEYPIFEDHREEPTLELAIDRPDIYWISVHNRKKTIN